MRKSIPPKVLSAASTGDLGQHPADVRVHERRPFFGTLDYPAGLVLDACKDNFRLGVHARLDEAGSNTAGATSDDGDAPRDSSQFGPLQARQSLIACHAAEVRPPSDPD